MTQRADLAVFIGRFQPFHLGHVYAMTEGFKLAKRVLVLVGDTGGPRTIKNPWTFDERRVMIRRAVGYGTSLVIQQIYDHPSDTEWMAQVHSIVTEVAEYGDDKNIILIGHDKDESSFYLSLFPQWKQVDTGYDELPGGLLKRYDATAIREMVWRNELHYAAGIIPPACLQFIIEHKALNPDIYSNLSEEYAFIQKYRDSWKSAPFPPVFVTTDCVVIQSGHILLIQRGQNPGKGLWALPGGFIDQRETIEDCAIRELVEETSIKLQEDVLRRCIRHVQVFDRAGRVSQEDRGRIITHCHLIKLDDTKPLPKVKGADDAAVAKWVPIGDIDYREIFSDHGKIIQAMLGRV